MGTAQNRIMNILRENGPMCAWDIKRECGTHGAYKQIKTLRIYGFIKVIGSVKTTNGMSTAIYAIAEE